MPTSDHRQQVAQPGAGDEHEDEGRGADERRGAHVHLAARSAPSSTADDGERDDEALQKLRAFASSRANHQASAVTAASFASSEGWKDAAPSESSARSL